DLALAHLDGGGVGCRPQALAALQDAPLPHLLDPGPVLGERGLSLLGAGRHHGRLVLSNQQCVAHGSSSWCQFTTTTNGAHPDRQRRPEILAPFRTTWEGVSRLPWSSSPPSTS